MYILSNNVLNIIIVEDDPIASDLLLSVLQKCTFSTKVVSICRTLADAKTAITEFQPQILLLDIELPDGNGIELLDLLDTNGSCEVIFTTSHDAYAIEAFRKNAVDYILKPVTVSALEDALQKVHQRMLLIERLALLDSLQEKLKETNVKPNEKFVVQTADGMQILKADEIVRVESYGNYTQFFLTSNRKFVSSKTLALFEFKLTESGFLRIHRSYMINAKFIAKIISDKNKSYLVEMQDGSKLEISRRRQKYFLEFFKH